MGTTSAKNALSTSGETIDPKFLDAMERLGSMTVKPPEGSFTVEDAEEAWGLSPSTTSNKLTGMVKSGTLDKVRIGKRNYYWFTEGQEE